jgi:hypothetical protein
MSLVDQYLKDVRRFLIGPAQDDIVRELRENIQSHIEDREAELRRPLGDTEVEQILAELGNPATVAARYRNDDRSLAFGRQLIGPALFPFYAKVLAFNVGITFVVCVAILAIRVAHGLPLGFSALSVVALQLLIQFATVTAIFMVAERRWVRAPAGPGRRQPPDAHAAAGATRIPRFESFAQVVAGAVFLVWLLAFRGVADSILVPGPRRIAIAPALTLAPVWHVMYLTLVWLAAIAVAQAAVNLLRPEWVRFRAAVRVATGVAWLVATYIVLTADRWIVVSPSLVLTGKRLQTVSWMERGFVYGLIVAAIISAIGVLRDMRQLLRKTSAAPGVDPV